MKNSTAIILILIAAGLFYTFLMPQYERVGALRTEAGVYEDVLDNISAIEDRRSELEMGLSSLAASDIASLSKILPSGVDAVRLALDIDNIAGKYGISIQNIQVDTQNDNTAVVQDTTGSAYGKVLISFSFVSNYENFKRFVSDLEKSLRIIDIRSITFTTAENGLNEYKLDIETYWLK